MQNAFGLQIPETLNEACSPGRSALLVYDMQVGILNQIDKREQVIEAVRRVLEAARQAGVRTFFLRHMSLPKNLAGVFQLRQAMQWQRVTRAEDVKPWFLRDSPGFAITEELDVLATEAVFDKITMSAFEGTPLDIALRDCGVDVFVLVGAAIEIGIDITVRHGADLGYIPVVVTDACGAGDDEAAKRALDVMDFVGDAILTNTGAICELWKPKS
jgi:biuret amidohydrolase